MDSYLNKSGRNISIQSFKGGGTKKLTTTKIVDFLVKSPLVMTVSWHKVRLQSMWIQNTNQIERWKSPKNIQLNMPPGSFLTPTD